MNKEDQSQPTPGPWAWQKFGDYYCLTAQHGMREIIIGALKTRPGIPFAAMNTGHRLEAVHPEHPNAKLIAAAPEVTDDASELLFFLKDVPLGKFEEATGMSSERLNQLIINLNRSVKKATGSNYGVSFNSNPE